MLYTRVYLQCFRTLFLGLFFIKTKDENKTVDRKQVFLYCKSFDLTNLKLKKGDWAERHGGRPRGVKSNLKKGKPQFNYERGNQSTERL